MGIGFNKVSLSFYRASSSAILSIYNFQLGSLFGYYKETYNSSLSWNRDLPIL
jgi:hypothetical protein